MKYQIKKLLVKGQENKKYSKLRKQDKEINLKQCNTKSNFKSYIYICMYFVYIFKVYIIFIVLFAYNYGFFEECNSIS